MKDIRLYKQLQSQLNLMLADSAGLKIDIANKQKEYVQKLKAIDKLKAEMEKLNNDGSLKVSEHAIVRYFERVKGFSIEEIEKEILSDEILKMVETLGGNGTYTNNGFSVLIKNHTVTTITKN